MTKTRSSKSATGNDQGTQGAEGGVDNGVEAASSGTEFVSLTAVREMHKVQESALRSLFESIVNSLTKRVDEVVKKVASLETSLEYSQKDIAELKPLHGQITAVNVDIDRLGRDISDQVSKAEYLENQSRRNNNRVNGIEESVGETWEETEEKVKEAVKAKLGMELEIERAHRVERRKRSQRSAEKPRTIVCRLRNWKQKEQVLREARREKPSGLYVSEDLALATLKKREPQIPKMKAAKEAGKIAYFVLDKLVIKQRGPDK